MSWFNNFLDRLGHGMADKLVRQSSGYEPYTPSDFATLNAILQPGDVLLVEGNQFISATIKYLTQSTWSHAALYVGTEIPDEHPLMPEAHRGKPMLVEVNLGQGCVAVPLERYQSFNTRICHPVGLTAADRKSVVDFMIGKLGTQYDMRNIFDMLRYFFPRIPVPVRWRRRMLALGSGDPTRAICSSLIAQAYQSIKYPILPEITAAPGRSHAESRFSRREILHIRHHSLFAPRDFDLSPYFEVIKPTIAKGFNYKLLQFSGKVSERDILASHHHKKDNELEEYEADASEGDKGEAS